MAGVGAAGEEGRGREREGLGRSIPRQKKNVLKYITNLLFLCYVSKILSNIDNMNCPRNNDYARDDNPENKTIMSFISCGLNNTVQKNQ